MVDQVDPKHIKEHVELTNTMVNALRVVVDMKEQALKKWTKIIADFEVVEKEMRGVLNDAKERCEYHRDLAEELKKMEKTPGKFKPEYIESRPKSIKSFIGVVKKMEQPRFDKPYKRYVELLEALKK